MVKTKLLFIIGAVTAPLWLVALAAFPGNALAYQAEKSAIRIEVSQYGFNNLSGESRLEVMAGQEIEITFVYGDTDLSYDNPHVIFITGYNIKTDTLDRENPEVTVRFIADRSGEINFMCILVCTGHDELQRGSIMILPGTSTPIAGEGNQLLLTITEQTQSGQPLTLTAVLQDSQYKPVANAPVKFFIKVDFFVSGLMEIGEAITNDQGVATLEYIPHLAGDVLIVTSYEDTETTATVTLSRSDEPSYQTDVGIRLPTLGKEVFIGPESALLPGETSSAPLTVFRLPGGILSWLLFLVVAIVLIWTTYFRVVYQVLRIPIVTEPSGTNTRLVAWIGIAVVVVLGTLLVLMLVTGPYSHPHILR